MRFLADENIHADVVVWLRSMGHDVLYASEAMRGISDDDLLGIAQREARILVSDDKDFGELVFHRRLASHGVILVRLGSPRMEARLQRLRQVWQAIESQAEGRFIVITDHKVRIRSMGRISR